MAEQQYNNEWLKDVAPRMSRPRIVFSDRMAVFSATGVRDSLFPVQKNIDGFDVLGHAIYVVGPQDLRPENHGTLKAILEDKIAKARAMPLSKAYMDELRDKFMLSTITETILKFPTAVLRAVGSKDAAFRDEFCTPATLKEFAASRAKEDFPDHARNRVLGVFKGDVNALYLFLKRTFAAHGKSNEFEACERTVAESSLKYDLSQTKLTPDQQEEALDKLVTFRPDGNGKQRVTLDVERMEALHRRLLDNAYQDLDKTINEQREKLVAHAREHGIDNPFEYTKKEADKIKEMERIVRENVPCKPVMVAGYCNPKLTIIMEDSAHPRRSGISYGPLNLIQMESNPKQTTFKELLQEEVLHQGIDNIYDNHSLPYHDDKDRRKTLLQRVIASEPNPRTHGNLGFSTHTGYDTSHESSAHQEIPVKTLKHMDTEFMQAIRISCGRNALVGMEEYLRKVTIPDAICYLQKKPLPDIGEDYSRTTPHAARAAKPRASWAL